MWVLDTYFTPVVLIGAAIIAAVFLQFTPISLTGLAAADIGTKFLSLTFMALVIERSVEIYVKNRFGTREAELKQPIRVASRAVRAHRGALEAASAAIVPTTANAVENEAAVATKYDAVKGLQQSLSEARDAHLKATEGAEAALQTLKTEKKRAATIASLVLSLAVAIVGLRILAQFVPADTFKNVAAAVNGTGQLQTFHTIDILITTLLLSGGADGIHQLVNGFLGDRDELTGGS